MPPKKKQKKDSGYMEFMKFIKPQLEAEGHRFPRGLVDVIPVGSQLWNKLSAEEKANYKKNAKEGSAGSTFVKEERCDTRGVPLKQKDREEQKKISEKEELLQKVEDMISYFAEEGSLENHYFHLGHFNIAVATTEKEYPPCELAIVKFSLLDGIAKQYHEFVDPGQIRLGYAHEAKLHSENTHKIPPLGFKLANKDYIGITNKIKEFLRQPDGGIAPLFVVDEDNAKGIYIVDWLVKKSCQMNDAYDACNPFKIYSLNKLFYDLRRHADLNDPTLRFSSISTVAEYFNKGTFFYSKHMSCEWHKTEDNETFCSLTRVRNYAYTISDLCCEFYDLALLPNRHCPAEISDDKYIVLPKATKQKEPQAKAEVKKKDEEDYEHPAGPCLPAAPATANSIGPGMGRGILGGSMVSSATRSPGRSQAVETAPTAGRGRGRGLLSLDDDSD